jgi:hypothetical protein
MLKPFNFCHKIFLLSFIFSVIILLAGCGGSNGTIEKKLEELSQRIDIVNKRVDSVNMKIDGLMLTTFEIEEATHSNIEKIKELRKISELEGANTQINKSPYVTEMEMKESIVSDCHNIGSMAQRYFKTPTQMDGGGNSFVGFEILPLLSENDNAVYKVMFANEKKVELRGTPKNGDYNWYVKAIVTKDDIRSSVEYDY